MRYELVLLDWRPPSLNTVRGRHWSRERKAKAAMAGALGAAKLAAGVPDLDALRARVRLSVHVTYAGREREMDEDNLTGKLLRDSLKLAHLIVDDSPDWLVTGEVTQARGERTATRVVLEVLR